ncbi:ABC transporter permease [Hyphomicrobium sp. ghe19]|uniref:ABC transporter permease n=1 Tax=Hyphomicrobium sp. ghe19 TaxID=2682968 RepID=UPI0013674BE9|nr:Inner membrane ABC transporter permease protein YdcV [Hyphomicrobium sp. ghe19]
MRALVFALYLFLYAPIALVVLFSFNSGRNASELVGFSTQWYGRALSNPFLMDALQTSLIVAFTSASLAAIFGTMAAIGLERLGQRTRAVFDGLLSAAIVVPGVVIGIATLVALVELFSFLNPAIAAVWPGADPPKLGLGYGSIVAAHGLFTMALVTMIVRARLASLGRDIVEASSDLYATPLTTFREIVFPQIAPSILAGFLLAFTFSFDDFIIAFFVAGSKTTLPIYVFASIRRGITPEINAIATIVLVASLVLIVMARFLTREKKLKSGDVVQKA